MSDSREDQIHPATPTRQQQARRDGDVAKSFELAAAIQITGAMVIGYFLVGGVGNWIKIWTSEYWSKAGASVSVEPADIVSQLQQTVFSIVWVLLPILALMFLLGVASHWLQTGPIFLPGKAVPDASRMSLFQWSQNLFSWNTPASLLSGVPKIVAAGTVLVLSVWYQHELFFALGSYPIESLGGQLMRLVFQVGIHVALALLLISGLDYWLKWLSFQRRVRMTDQQLRDELRAQNGDPQIQSRIRNRQLDRV